jgi:hypothetical protein
MAKHQLLYHFRNQLIEVELEIHDEPDDEDGIGGESSERGTATSSSAASMAQVHGDGKVYHRLCVILQG